MIIRPHHKIALFAVFLLLCVESALCYWYISRYRQSVFDATRLACIPFSRYLQTDMESKLNLQFTIWDIHGIEPLIRDMRTAIPEIRFVEVTDYYDNCIYYSSHNRHLWFPDIIYDDPLDVIYDSTKKPPQSFLNSDSKEKWFANVYGFSEMKDLATICLITEPDIKREMGYLHITFIPESVDRKTYNRIYECIAFIVASLIFMWEIISRLSQRFTTGPVERLMRFNEYHFGFLDKPIKRLPYFDHINLQTGLNHAGELIADHHRRFDAIESKTTLIKRHKDNIAVTANRITQRIDRLRQIYPLPVTGELTYQVSNIKIQWKKTLSSLDHLKKTGQFPVNPPRMPIDRIADTYQSAGTLLALFLSTFCQALTWFRFSNEAIPFFTAAQPCWNEITQSLPLLGAALITAITFFHTHRLITHTNIKYLYPLMLISQAISFFGSAVTDPGQPVHLFFRLLTTASWGSVMVCSFTLVCAQNRLRPSSEERQRVIVTALHGFISGTMMSGLFCSHIPHGFTDSFGGILISISAVIAAVRLKSMGCIPLPDTGLLLPSPDAWMQKWLTGSRFIFPAAAFALGLVVIPGWLLNRFNPVHMIIWSVSGSLAVFYIAQQLSTIKNVSRIGPVITTICEWATGLIAVTPGEINATRVSLLMLLLAATIGTRQWTRRHQNPEAPKSGLFISSGNGFGCTGCLIAGGMVGIFLLAHGGVPAAFFWLGGGICISAALKTLSLGYSFACWVRETRRIPPLPEMTDAAPVIFK